MLNLRGKPLECSTIQASNILPAVAFLSLSSSLQIQVVLTTVLESTSSISVRKLDQSKGTFHYQEYIP
jgi:hypothetical protein